MLFAVLDSNSCSVKRKATARSSRHPTPISFPHWPQENGDEDGQWHHLACDLKDLLSKGRETMILGYRVRTCAIEPPQPKSWDMFNLWSLDSTLYITKKLCLMTTDTWGHVAVQLAWCSCVACDSIRYVSLLVKGIGERKLPISHCFLRILGRAAISGIHAPALMKPFWRLAGSEITSDWEGPFPAGVGQQMFFEISRE